MHMKKILLLTFVGTLFAAGSAFAHCGSCGTGEEAHEHAAKACCSEKAGECCKAAKACCSDKAGECCKKKSACKSDCTKPCCGKEKAEKAADATAAAKAPSCCPASKAGNPA